MALLTGEVKVVDCFDHGCVLVSRNPFAVGVLWMSALPVRMLMVSLIMTLMHLGDQAQHAGKALQSSALWIMLAWLLSIWGRQVYVRACTLSMSGNVSTVRELLRVPWSALSAHLHAALVIEGLFWATLPLLVLWPLGIALAALAAITAPTLGSGWLKPIRSLALPAGSPAVVVLTAGAGAGVLLAALNLHVFAQGCRWLCGAFIGMDTSAWSPLLSQSHPLYVTLLLVGGGLIVEPFYLASLVVVVDRAYARTNGQDLQHWLAQISQRYPALPQDHV